MYNFLNQKWMAWIIKGCRWHIPQIQNSQFIHHIATESFKTFMFIITDELLCLLHLRKNRTWAPMDMLLLIDIFQTGSRRWRSVKPGGARHGVWRCTTGGWSPQEGGGSSLPTTACRPEISACWSRWRKRCLPWKSTSSAVSSMDSSFLRDSADSSFLVVLWCWFCNLGVKNYARVCGWSPMC